MSESNIIGRVGLMVLAAVVGACSSPPADPVVAGPRADAEQMVVDDLGPALGLGAVVASCEEPPPLAVGARWGCTATSETGQRIDIAGSVNPEGHMELVTTNVISEAALPSFERDAASALNNEVGSSFTADSVDCGQGPLILGSDMAVNCVLIMPSSGVTYDLLMQITDLDARHFALQVADQPREQPQSE